MWSTIVHTLTVVKVCLTLINKCTLSHMCMMKNDLWWSLMFGILQLDVIILYKRYGLQGTFSSSVLGAKLQISVQGQPSTPEDMVISWASWKNNFNHHSQNGCNKSKMIIHYVECLVWNNKYAASIVENQKLGTLWEKYFVKSLTLFILFCSFTQHRQLENWHQKLQMEWQNWWHIGPKHKDSTMWPVRQWKTESGHQVHWPLWWRW